MDRGANNLTTSLYFAEPGMLLTIVLTASLYVQIYLTGLSALRIVSGLKVKRIKNRAELERYFDQLSDPDYSQTLIVARDIYTNYYGVVQTCRHLKQFIAA
jgi:hypothetical protein